VSSGGAIRWKNDRRFAFPLFQRYPETVSELSLSFATSMSSMSAADRAAWDSLASRYGCPFYMWGFLALLEESGSIVPEKGWTPIHLLLKREGRLVGAAPLYAKTASNGEFVFDFEFARVAQDNDIAWYPKLVAMIPVTPSPLWRVLVAEGEDESALTKLVLDAALELARTNGFGGFHVLWPSDSVAALLRQRRALGRDLRRGRAGEDFTAWEHQTFLWKDRLPEAPAGFGSFEGWLGAFSKNMRRNVLREREGLDAAGVERRIIESDEAAGTPGLLSRMADFYEDTNERFGPWAARWLERDFFLRLPEFMPTGWIMGAGFAPGDKEPIGLSFMMRGDQGLWGRYWGSSRFEAGLHFELCYYLPIEWALSRGLGFFDPGMGSEHKARRGFHSVLAPSFHAIFEARMADLVHRSLEPANRGAAQAVTLLNGELPYRRGQAAVAEPGPPKGNKYED
jgi:hypothetical protein